MGTSLESGQTRGAANQDLRKVKGHATAAAVKQGRGNAADKKGNDTSDTNADKGGEMIKGEGLVRLGEGVAKRHESCNKICRGYTR